MRQKSTYVYVVCSGEYEGHDPVATWTTLKGALDDAVRMFGVRPTHVGGVAWKASINGTDEVYIRRLTVKGATS